MSESLRQRILTSFRVFPGLLTLTEKREPDEGEAVLFFVVMLQQNILCS